MPPKNYQQPPPRGNLFWVYIDLDNTLAEGIWTPDNPVTDIGDPIDANVKKARHVAAEGFKIVIHTSRAWTDYEAIEYWLRYWQVPFDNIQCGKPLGALYIDDRARHSDAFDWSPTSPTVDEDALLHENDNLRELLVLLQRSNWTRKDAGRVQKLRIELGL